MFVVGLAVMSFPLWPASQSATNGSTTLSVTPSASFFACSSGPSKFLTEAFARYGALAFPHVSDSMHASESMHASDSKATATAAVAGLRIAVDDLDE
jgi:hypothetical protein